MKKQPTWYLTDHLCKYCGGRVLQGASSFGPTGGGNPVFRCADCGKGGAHSGPEIICWCGLKHRLQQESAYMCLPFSITEKHPNLKIAFAHCGFDTEEGEVGVVLKETYYKYLREEGGKE